MPTENASEEQRTAEAKAAFLASLNSVGSNADVALQARAKDIQAGSLQLSKQEADVAKGTEALAKSTAQYQQIADEGREKLKEIGDVQNWAEMIERDLLVLEETMRIAEEEEADEQAAGGKDGAKSKSGLGWW
jgi:predicted transposase YdaD